VLSKKQAIQAMKKGQKVRHRSFTSSEWVKIAEHRVNRYEFEDGCISKVDEFWSTRKHENWLTDWEIVE
jgi:hypothetical protein